ncbi:MAG: PQQ-dependent dehydrogenase, methanol/ethanol family [Steroidobacteraceae bacterium]
MNVLKVAAVIAAFALSGCGQPPETASNRKTARVANVTDAKLRAADAEPGQWMSHGRNYDEQRFSPLKQINAENVGQLGLAWFSDFDTNRGQEATPLVIDGVIYVSTAWSKVYAYDARSGKELWKYDPKIPGSWGVNVCCDVVNRGLAAWEGKIFVGTLDGRLIALNAETGAEVWSTSTIDPEKRYSITGAPRVANGLVLIGQAGAEFGVRGYVTAYSADTGKQVWRFYTVPGNPADGFENDTMKQAATTWKGEWWKLGGGGTVWDAIVYDQELDQVYIGVGNGSPWNASIRSPGGGDNLFLSSIVALDAKTGAYRWHYQTTPRESWDYTAAQPIMIANLPIGGVTRRVVMQAPKNGFFYVLDAKAGTLLSAEAFATVNWASGIDLKTGRPIENPAARYEETGKGFTIAPGPGGAHSWHPWSYSPDTGLVYIPAQDSVFGYVAEKEENFVITNTGINVGVDFVAGRGLAGQKGQMKPISQGFLLAWNPVTQKEAWRVTYEKGRGGGTLSTAGGLVFQGASGSNEFAAYGAADGKKLWASQVQTGVVAGAVSFEVDGEQLIAVLAGSNSAVDYYASNHSRLLVFKLGGKATLPAPEPYTARPLSPPPATADAQLVAHGNELFSRYCNLCHGLDGLSRGMFPDLTRTPLLHTQAGISAVVLGGALSQRGMASFAKDLKEPDVEAIRAYLIAKANELVAAGNTGARPPGLDVPTADNDINAKKKTVDR